MAWPACTPAMAPRTSPSPHTWPETPRGRPRQPQASKTAASSPDGTQATSKHSSARQPKSFKRFPCLLDRDRKPRPLLYDENFVAKPAREAVIRALEHVAPLRTAQPCAAEPVRRLKP